MSQIKKMKALYYNNQEVFNRDEYELEFSYVAFLREISGCSGRGMAQPNRMASKGQSSKKADE